MKKTNTRPQPKANQRKVTVKRTVSEENLPVITEVTEPIINEDILAEEAQQVSEFIEQHAVLEVAVIETEEPVKIEEPLQLQIPTLEIEDVDNVLGSKRYVKGMTEYRTPAEILRSSIDLLMTTGGKLTLQGGNEVKNMNEDGTVNTAYGRLNLVCRFDIDEEIFYEIGVLVALDIQKPTIKVYVGPKVYACMNLCIFQADDVVTFLVEQGINMESINMYVSTIHERMRKAIETINGLKAIALDVPSVNKMMGNILMNTTKAKTANGTTHILRAAEYLTNPKSKYFYEQKDFNAWKLYNALTENFGSKTVNFFDVPEKARDTYSLLLTAQ